MKPHLKEIFAKIMVRLGIHDPNNAHNKAINKSFAMEWLCDPWKVDHNVNQPSHGPPSWLLGFDNAGNPDAFRPYGDIAQSGAERFESRAVTPWLNQAWYETQSTSTYKVLNRRILAGIDGLSSAFRMLTTLSRLASMDRV